MRLLWFAVCVHLLVTSAGPAARPVSDEEVRRVHAGVLLIDSHNDLPSYTISGFADPGAPSPYNDTDIARLRRGGVGAVFFSAYVAKEYAARGTAAQRADEMIRTIHRDIVGKNSQQFALARTTDEIERIHRDGKIAALIGLEGGHAIEDRLSSLQGFYDQGVRYMTLTHTNTNHWADSSGDARNPRVPHHNGLTAFGKDVVREMNRLGMIVDVSHVADKTFWDVLAISSAPVFASHSSCRALCSAPRNMTDEMIIALAKKGGVIQINFACDFLSQAAFDSRKGASPTDFTLRERVRQRSRTQPAAMAQAWKQVNQEIARRWTPATLADVVAHIDHVVRIAGVEAVGIGSDFDGVGCTPVGLEDVSRFPNLTRALLERGYTAGQIAQIYGGNTLRLMRAVQSISRRTGIPSTPSSGAQPGPK